MKRITSSLLLISLCLTLLGQTSDNFFTSNFLNIQESKELLQTADQFTNSWSQFDIDSRLHKKGGSKSDLFDHIADQVRPWNEREKSIIKNILYKFEKSIQAQKFNLDFPDEINFIKTTAQEEGGANGYTRSNYIVIKESSLVGPFKDIEQLVIHEIFHVLSRHSSSFREKLYNMIGFKMMKSIDYPESLKDYRITNPDAPQTDSYITLKVNDSYADCMMILYSKKEYGGGDFFQYLNVGFLKLKGDEKKIVDLINDKPVIYSMNEVKGFFEQVGRNTQYIIHPEEILADNFTHLFSPKKGIEDEWLIEKIKKVLSY